MKYIVAYVLFGLVAYAGVSLLFSGIRQAGVSVQKPIPLSSISREGYTSGMAVSAKINQQLGKLRSTTTTRLELFGIEFGEPVVQYYYVIPAGAVTEPSEQRYMLLCVTTDEDVAALDGLYSPELLAAGDSAGEPLECEGVLTKMETSLVDKLIYYLMNNGHLVGWSRYFDTTDTYCYNHISQYTFYVHRNKGGEALPIIIGAALTAVGAGGIVLLAVKKHRESTGY